MITIKNMKSLSGTIEDLEMESEDNYSYDAEGKLIGLPGLIDTNVHFRTPGGEKKENWISGAKAAIQGGVTTVFDMPDNTPPCVDPKSFGNKKSLIEQQLASCGIPLRYHLFLGADREGIETVGQIRNEIIGIKVSMESLSKGLEKNDPKALDRTFELAAQYNLIVAVHAEDEGVLKERHAAFSHLTNPADHSVIRDRQAAIKATEKAISLAEKYNSQVYLLNLSTKEELDLVRQAKQRQILAFAEVSPHHLFLNEDDYEKWGTKVQVNPPLRTRKDQEALWEGIHDKTVDSIGSDHAPHSLNEKNQPFGKAPSGIPGVETTLPLLLNAVNRGKMSLEQIVNLMRINPEQIYNLPHNNDFVLVDMEMEKILSDEMLQNKCGWSPYCGRTLKGWPVYTIVQNKIFKVN